MVMMKLKVFSTCSAEMNSSSVAYATSQTLAESEATLNSGHLKYQQLCDRK